MITDRVRVSGVSANAAIRAFELVSDMLSVDKLREQASTPPYEQSKMISREKISRSLSCDCVRAVFHAFNAITPVVPQEFKKFKFLEAKSTFIDTYGAEHLNVNTYVY